MRPLVLCVTVSALLLTACGLDWSRAKAPLDAGDDSGSEPSAERDAADPPASDDDAALADATVDGDDADAGDDDATLAGDAAVPDDAGSAVLPLPEQGLVLWLRADEGLELSDAGTVSAWIDRASGQRAVQPLPDFQPHLRGPAADAPPAILFDGTDDFFGLPGVDYDFTEGFTLFVVELNVDTQGDTYQPFFELSNGQEIDDVSFGRHRRRLHVEIDDQPSSADVIPAGRVQLVSARLTQNRRLDTRLDGRPLNGFDLDHVPRTLPRTSALIGASLYVNALAFGGELYEIVIYNRALSDAAWADVEHTLRARWQRCR